MSGRKDEPMERWPDARLLHAAHRGNQEAFAIFCVRSLPALIRYLEVQCTNVGVPRDRARDFAQETLSKALEQVRLYREDGGRPLPKVSVAWLSQIAYNLVMDSLRERQRETRAKHAHIETKQSAPTQEDLEKLETVYKFYTWLTPAEQELIELVLVEGLTQKEAGERLGLSPKTAYKRYERAVDHLRDLILEHGDPSIRRLFDSGIFDCSDEEE